MKITYYADCGISPSDSVISVMKLWADNGIITNLLITNFGI